MQYKCLPTSDCLAMLKKEKLALIEFDPSIKIGSPYALGFKLSTGEIVLVNSNIGQDYVGFVFSNFAAFKKMKKNGYFPVGELYESFWERERDRLALLPSTVIFYKTYLQQQLHMNALSFKDMSEIKDIYDSILAVFPTLSDKEIKRKILLSFALNLIEHFNNINQQKWEFETRYEIYNSYKYPLLKIRKRKIDVISALASALESKDDFSEFLAYLERDL